jgi:uncharacterized protein (TIGR03437 family)
MQVNIRVPGGVAPGQMALKLSVGGFASPAVTVWVE